MAWIDSPVSAYSSLLGGLTCTVPGFIVAKRFQRIKASADHGSIVRGELVKFALSVVFFIAVFTLVEPLAVVYFFGTFAVLQLAWVVVPLQEARRLRRTDKS